MGIVVDALRRLEERGTRVGAFANAAADARELEPVEAPPQAHDDGLCGGSLMCDRAPVGGFSMEV